MAGLTRRQAVGVMAATVAQFYGKVEASGQSRAAVLTVMLDGVDGVAVRYRGQVVMVHPQELMDVLRGAK